MVCPKCQSEIYDNRSDKATGAKSTKWPDFKCKNKACDWAQWPEKPKASSVAAPPPIASQNAPQAQGNGSGRDAALVTLYWTCFDEIMAGLKSRALQGGFPGDQIASMTAALYIARSKIL